VQSGSDKRVWASARQQIEEAHPKEDNSDGQNRGKCFLGSFQSAWLLRTQLPLGDVQATMFVKVEQHILSNRVHSPSFLLFQHIPALLAMLAKARTTVDDVSLLCFATVLLRKFF
jgi:hypothetical protein